MVSCVHLFYKRCDDMAAPKLISRRYEVLELLGQGGMGTVYKVRHTALGSISALKVLPPELMQDPEMVTRFYREARIMANLSHPSIVRVLDIDQDDTLDFHYFVMEHVEGQTLKQYVEKKGSLTLEETLDVVGQVARALAYAHAHSPPIIHRDIKPSNIMIEGRSGRVVVMDFGIAKELDGNELTRPGVTIGTLKYCAPEQMRQEQLDGAVDVYALGMVAYEAYTGKHLFAGLGERELVARVLVEKSENAPVFEKPTPQPFADLVARAIAKAREVRFASMAGFLKELEAVVAECATAPARTGTTGRFRPRLVASRGDAARSDAPRVTELKPEWRDEAATGPAPAGPAPQLEQQVQEVRDRTGVLRDATSSVKGRHRDRAERGWRRAERLLEEGKLADAKTSFEEAATLFSALTSRVQDDGTPASAAPPTPARPVRTEDAIGSAAIARPHTDETVVAPEPTVAVPAAAASTVAASAVPAPAAPDAPAPTTYAPLPQEARGAGPESPAAVPRPGAAWHAPALIAGTLALLGGIALFVCWGSQAPPPEPPAAPPPAQPVAAAPAKEPAIAAPASVAVLPAQGAGAVPAGDAKAAASAAGPAADRVVDTAGGGGAPSSDVAAVPPAPTGAPPDPVAAAPLDPAPADAEAARDERVAAIEPAAAAPDGPALIRFTRNPTVDIEAPAPPSAVATIDGRPMKADRSGRVRGSLTGLPVGTSEHALRITDPATGAVQDTPVVVTYYPAWEVRRFGEVNGEAYAVAFSPDGSRVLAGTRSNVVKLWDAATGEVVRTFSGHKDWVNDVAFSPDGTMVVSGSKDRTLKLWDVESGSDLRTLAGHKGWVNGVAFSPDGSKVASVSDDQTVKIWDVATGEQLASLTGHKDWILAVAFSADGTLVASGGRDKVVKVWDVSSGELVRTLTGHTDWVNAVAFSPDRKLLASASDDRRVKLWDVESGKNVKTLSGHGGWVVGVAFSPDGSELVSASKDQTVRLWDVASGEELRTFSGHKGLVGDVAFGPDGKTAVSGGRDRTLRLWWTAREPSREAREVEKGRDSG